jgi:hypothetical protein
MDNDPMTPNIIHLLSLLGKLDNIQLHLLFFIVLLAPPMGFYTVCYLFKRQPICNTRKSYPGQLVHIACCLNMSGKYPSKYTPKQSPFFLDLFDLQKM